MKVDEEFAKCTSLELNIWSSICFWAAFTSACLLAIFVLTLAYAGKLQVFDAIFLTAIFGSIVFYSMRLSKKCQWHIRTGNITVNKEKDKKVEDLLVEILKKRGLI